MFGKKYCTSKAGYFETIEKNVRIAKKFPDWKAKFWIEFCQAWLVLKYITKINLLNLK